MARDPTRTRFEPRGRYVFTDQRPHGRDCIAALDLDTLRVAVIDPAELRVYSLCDGDREAADIARLSGGIDAVEVDRVLARLEGLGLVRRTPRPSLDPSDSLPRAALEWARRAPSDRSGTVTAGTPFISDRMWRERTPSGDEATALDSSAGPRSSSELHRLVDDAVEAVLGFPDRDSM